MAIKLDLIEVCGFSLGSEYADFNRNCYDLGDPRIRTLKTKYFKAF